MLSGKTILISGASKGIGAAIASLFCQHGADLVLISRNLESLENQRNELLKICPEVQIECFSCDIREQTQIKEVFTKLNQKGIQLDGIVNNAGVMTSSMLMLMKPEELQLNFETNVYGAFYLTQFAIKHFIKKKKGFVINISSIIGIEGFKGQSAYSASKSAIIGFTKSLSKELAALKIRVNAIAPGFIDTEMTASISQEEIIKTIPLGVVGTTEDVANAALFLASDLSSYITGQVLGVDGGMII